MLMQSSILDIVQLTLLNNICHIYTPANGLYANYRGQRSSSAFLFKRLNFDKTTAFWFILSLLILNKAIKMSSGFVLDVYELQMKLTQVWI